MKSAAIGLRTEALKRRILLPYQPVTAIIIIFRNGSFIVQMTDEKSRKCLLTFGAELRMQLQFIDGRENATVCYETFHAIRRGG